MTNGDEWAWQAKFFRFSPGNSQWQQIDDSVKRALDKHPRLTKYTVCLPIDLPDSREDNQESARDKWNHRVANWEKLATEKGMSVTFEYWNQSEIASRLSDEQRRGRHWFWFNEERFSNSWFADEVSEAVANARGRYTPDLNVDLPIRAKFDERTKRDRCDYGGIGNLHTGPGLTDRAVGVLATPKTLPSLPRSHLSCFRCPFSCPNVNAS